MSRTGAGAALYAVRTGAGMTQREVSMAAGTSASYLSRVENNRATPTAGWIRMVAIAIGENLRPQ